MPGPYALTTYDGRPVDWITRLALEEAARRLGYADGLTLLQGSYQAGNKLKPEQSAGTHDGGGVVDLAPYQADRKVEVLRAVGFAAWHRRELWREGRRIWGEHVHAVLIGNERLAPAAAAQVADYLAGRNGLADHGLDDGPRDHVDARFAWPAPNRTQRGRRLIRRALAVLDTIPAGSRPAVERARETIRTTLDKMPRR